MFSTSNFLLFSCQNIISVYNQVFSAFFIWCDCSSFLEPIMSLKSEYSSWNLYKYSRKFGEKFIVMWSLSFTLCSVFSFVSILCFVPYLYLIWFHLGCRHVLYAICHFPLPEFELELHPCHFSSLLMLLILFLAPLQSSVHPCLSHVYKSCCHHCVIEKKPVLVL